MVRDLKYCRMVESLRCTRRNHLLLQLVLPRNVVPLSFTHQPSCSTTSAEEAEEEGEEGRGAKYKLMARKSTNEVG